jgi:RNA polymerase sigma-70 factor (ECF subfamily)
MLYNDAMDDIEVIRRVRAGERNAYADLVRRYQGRVMALCRTLLGNSPEVEDAAQEAFIKAYQSLDKFQGQSSFYTWIYRIASNHCLSLLRSKSRHPAESLDAIVEEEKEGLFRLFSNSDPRAAVEAQALVDKILSGIRPNYRLVLILRERDELSYEEIAQVMEVSVDSVKALLRRAREEVQEKLRHFLPAEGV